MNRRRVVPVALSGADGLPLLAPLREALSGAGPAVLPHQAGSDPDRAAVTDLQDDEDSPADPVAAVVGTSGSTGTPKHVMLPASAVLASAAATHDRLGGSGTWLLAVPAHTVAGLMVIARSLVARTRPTVLDLGRGFRADGFVAASAELSTRGRRYTSLVPTQLRRLLASGPAATDALRGFDAVLVGGAALDTRLRAQAEARGVPVVATYGMTETCGGCVYDGTALPGVLVDLDPAGRVLLGGPVVARGYRSGTAGEDFRVADGQRWFRTPDTGTLAEGRLQVSGRVDDVAVSGGANIPLVPVQELIAQLPGVRECLVVAVPDPEWGELVGVLVVASDDGGTADSRTGDSGARLLAVAREVVGRQVGRAAAPRVLLVVPALPLLGVGKPDRTRARDLLLGPGATRTPAAGDHVSDEPGGTRSTCDS